ncbi:MAG: DUF1592 domain-containing protein [Planctomycetes bacterium]|nr:DUF1592 domain-containing protein [Planctomycetota bacterium]
MRRWVIVFVLGVALVTQGETIAISGVAQEKGSATTVDFSRDIAPLLSKHCAGCHDGAKPKADLTLTFKDAAAASKNKPLWEKVGRQLRTGAMPPAGRPRPTLEEFDTIRGWIDKDMLAVDCTGKRDPGRVTIRRLNKSEYNNTLRDLLLIKDFNASDDFPSDDVGYGFDNIGDVLTLSPLHLERYLAAAEKAMNFAFKSRGFRDKFLPDLNEKDKLARIALAGKALEKFGTQAYRRPIEGGEVGRLLRFVDLALDNKKSFEDGLKLAMQAALVSPHFVFRVEKDPQEAKGETYRLTPYELASRLSYFLWSSMLDDELFELARTGDLHKTKNIEDQVRRMLKDPKAKALTENFAGQWLNLRLLRNSSPDPKLFRNWGEPLREAMIKESELFFEAIVQEDRSILDFLDADFTFVNEPLAKHYGIPGIKGAGFQRAKVDGGQRGGILTQASILTLTSNPNRTSPVKRGKWILENILNTPPPPPPPDAGELPDDGKELSGSLRQRMEQHRSKAICASCHQRMDPLGFALENYDAIGAYRIRDGSYPIDSTGELPDGKKFQGPVGLRSILKERAAEFRRCLAEKLLTYALGRGLEYYDKCAVDDICAAVEKADNRFSSLVLAIVKSDPFQMRKAKGGKS